MAKADITLRGRIFSVACAPGQETRVAQLGKQLDARLDVIAEAVGDIGAERLLLVAAVALLDELDAARRAAQPNMDAEARSEARLAAAADRIAALADRIDGCA